MKVRTNHLKVAISLYIQYNMDQLCLPMDLEEDNPANHLIRVVNVAVNRVDEAIFDAAYPDGSDQTSEPLIASVLSE